MNRISQIADRVASRIVAPPRMVSKIVSMVDRLKGFNGSKKPVIDKVSMDLTGWAYRDVVEKSDNFDQVKIEFGRLFVRIVPNVDKDYGDYANGILSLYLDPSNFPEDIEGVIEHELIHYAQEILDTATGGKIGQIHDSPDIDQHLVELGAGA